MNRARVHMCLKTVARDDPPLFLLCWGDAGDGRSKVFSDVFSDDDNDDDDDDDAAAAAGDESGGNMSATSTKISPAQNKATSLSPS